mgnify:FL=1
MGGPGPQCAAVWQTAHRSRHVCACGAVRNRSSITTGYRPHHRHVRAGAAVGSLPVDAGPTNPRCPPASTCPFLGVQAAMRACRPLAGCKALHQCQPSPRHLPEVRKFHLAPKRKSPTAGASVGGAHGADDLLIPASASFGAVVTDDRTSCVGRSPRLMGAPWICRPRLQRGRGLASTASCRQRWPVVVRDDRR